MHPTLRPAALLFVVFCATHGLAQETPAQTFGESIEVRIIDLDVVVTDKAGKPVTGLKREDFELLEDGNPVEIRYFTAVADPLSAGPATGIGAPAGSDPSESLPVTWIVFIDQTNMPPGLRNHALRSLRAFLDTSLAPDDRAMIANNDGMAMRVPQNITADHSALLATLSKLEKERVHPSPSAMQASQVLHDIRQAGSSEAGPGRRVASDTMNADYFADYIGAQISTIIAAEAQRTRNAIRAMGTLVDVLAAVEGRLALVYAGAGFNPLPAQELTDAWRTAFPSKGGVGAPDPSREQQYIQKELDQLFANLSATRVAVYTIYASTTATAGSVQDAGGSILNNDRGIAGDRARNIEASLARDMAQRTGGLYFTANPELSRQLEAVRIDLTHYYSLGYVPEGRPGKAREVTVRVRADGARVRHRRVVRERTRSEEAGRAVVASVAGPRTRAVARRVAMPAAPPAAASVAPSNGDAVTESNPLSVQVQDVRPRPDGWSKNHVLPFDLKLGAVTFVPRGKVHRAEFVLHFALVDPEGTVWPLESRDHALEVPAEEIPQSAEEHMSLLWHLDLAPLRIPAEVPVGRNGMKLVVTVEDRGANTRSVVTVPVGKPGERWFPEK